MKLCLEFKPKNFFFKTSLFTIITVVTYIYISPFITLLKFKHAVENNNYNYAEKYIDFPSVRKSLKGQLFEAFQTGLTKNVRINSFSKLGFVIIKPIASVILDSIVEATVTPYGLTLLMKKGELIENDKLSEYQKKSLPLKIPNENNNKENSPENIKMKYLSYQNFVVKSRIENSEEPIKAILTRKNIFNWQLTSVDIPQELLDNILMNIKLK